MSASVSPVARSVPFDNTTNGFVSTDVQGAIEEIRTKGDDDSKYDRALMLNPNGGNGFFKTYTYDPKCNLTEIDVYTDSTKATQLYKKTFTYGNCCLLQSVTLADLINQVTVTKTFNYNSCGDLVSIQEA